MWLQSVLPLPGSKLVIAIGAEASSPEACWTVEEQDLLLPEELEQGRRRVAVADGLGLPQLRAGLELEAHQAGLLGVGRDDDDAIVHERRRAPAEHGRLAAVVLLQVDDPVERLGLAVEDGHVPEAAAAHDARPDDRGHRARAGEVEPARDRVARAPELRPGLEREGAQDVALVVDAVEQEDLAALHRDAPVARSDGGAPGDRRAALGPIEAQLDAVHGPGALGPQELGPILRDGAQSERDQGAGKGKLEHGSSKRVTDSLPGG